MTSQPSSQTITIQTMKFGLLIEQKMNIIFVEKSYRQNVEDKLFPDPYLKN